jgi:uncharacterized protein (TIGR02444 family)
MGQVPSLWDFALSFYACPGVSDACLRLQDEHGIDINMLMFAAWAGQVRGVSLSEDDASQVIGASRPWQEQVVAPVRDLRRRLKKVDGLAGDAHLAGMLDAVKALELQGERAELEKTEALASRLFTGRPCVRGASIATDNIARTLLASGVPDSAVRGALPVFIGALRSLR